MEVMDSIIGHSVAKPLTPAQEQKDHQRVLCLDGGGMKVKQSILFILKKKGIWLVCRSGVARGGPSRARPDQLCSRNAYYLTVDCISPSIL